MRKYLIKFDYPSKEGLVNIRIKKNRSGVITTTVKDEGGNIISPSKKLKEDLNNLIFQMRREEDE